MSFCVIASLNTMIKVLAVPFTLSMTFKSVKDFHPLIDFINLIYDKDLGKQYSLNFLMPSSQWNLT